jgi:3-hydroxyisobutyrate dehydrogenase
MIDAPVSGNPSRARNGSLTLIVGGEEHLVRRASPVLEALGTIHRVGGLGSGHTLKALNNLLASINLAASAEIMLVGRRLGLETEIMLSTLNACTGRNDATENKIGQFVLPRSFDSGFRLALMRKDISNALELASRTGSPCDFGQVCDRLWGAALDELGPSADNLQVLRLMERAAHAELA